MYPPHESTSANQREATSIESPIAPRRTPRGTLAPDSQTRSQQAPETTASPATAGTSAAVASPGTIVPTRMAAPAPWSQPITKAGPAGSQPSRTPRDRASKANGAQGRPRPTTISGRVQAEDCLIGSASAVAHASA